MHEPKMPPRPGYWSRSRIKSVLTQAIFLSAVGFVLWFLWSNTAQNLSQQGIASGFGFLSSRSGFDVSLSFIPFNNDSTYATAFWVAVINTLVLAGLGIGLATLLGFSLGLARVSKNWLIARLATVYIEVFRNIPLLLQLFVWYFAILRPLPRPRDSVALADLVFVNNRGLFFPSPIFETGIGWVVAVLMVGLVAAMLMRWRAQRIRVETSRTVYQWYWWVLALFVAPTLAWILSGTSVT
ncbi:MAG: general L-amino acid transport system permease protein, partial [Pseudomonadales bacterium]